MFTKLVNLNQNELEKKNRSVAEEHVIETGDEPAACAGRRTLVLANHQSTADVPMLMAAWNPRPGVLPNLMWIMDRIFKFTNFGIVSVLHEDFFIQALNILVYYRIKEEKRTEI
ncbi:unnamed protein product [Arctia plantaginis]|uniref:Phospholipid/glycerol acyltransferase domain-containing protein n=1 Tax=Arctia plantaginis TaxID=874455 RepID=A0A8S0ZZL7_ARCPL|nr:unnamed protein product [Arctia plantaginis]